MSEVILSTYQRPYIVLIRGGGRGATLRDSSTAEPIAKSEIGFKKKENEIF